MKLLDYDTFIFDLDGTLIDSEHCHAQAYADAVLTLCGYRLTAGEKNEFFASNSLQFSLVLNGRHGLRLDPEQVLNRKRARVQEIFEADLYDGVLEFLGRWHGRKSFGVATNSPREFVQLALESAGISRYFEVVTTADDVANPKPDPEIFEITMRKLGAAPPKTLVFEDQHIGMAAARAAGAHVLAVDNGQPVQFPAGIPVASWKDLLRYE